MLLLSLSSGQTESEPEAVALLTAVSQRMVGVDQTSLITLTRTDRHDSVRVRQFQLWMHYPHSADSILKQTLVVILQPEKAAGQKYWSWAMSDGRVKRWIYLPGSGKLQEFSRRRDKRNQDFDLSELEVTPEQIDSHINQVVERQFLDGREVVLVKCVERAAGERRLRRIKWRPGYKLLWIDPGTLLIRQAEFYTPRGRLQKRFTVEETEIHQGRELATSIRIRGARKKTKTEITISDLSLEPITDRRLFQPAAD